MPDKEPVGPHQPRNAFIVGEAAAKTVVTPSVRQPNAAETRAAAATPVFFLRASLVFPITFEDIVVSTEDFTNQSESFNWELCAQTR